MTLSVRQINRKINQSIQVLRMHLYDYDLIGNTKLCLSEKEARRIFIQLMSAVAYLHDNGIAHRDLKPVIICKMQTIKAMFDHHC